MMTRWNALSSSQKGFALGLAVAIILAGFAFGAYAAGVRCELEGSFFTCAKKGLLQAPTESGSMTENATSTPLSEADDRPEPVSVNGDVVVVNDQPAGPVVEVTMLTLAEPGWVAVYEDRGGAPGNVLGAGRFEEGIHLGEISLLRSTSPGLTYYLILHADTNDREFDLKKNPIIIGENGAPIRATFRTFSD